MILWTNILSINWPCQIAFVEAWVAGSRWKSVLARCVVATKPIHGRLDSTEFLLELLQRCMSMQAVTGFGLHCRFKTIAKSLVAVLTGASLVYDLLHILLAKANQRACRLLAIEDQLSWARNLRACYSVEPLLVHWYLVELHISLECTVFIFLVVESAFWVVELPWLSFNVDGLVITVQVLEHVVAVASEIAPHQAQMGLGCLLSWKCWS